jgi:hypothetical protein
MRLKVRITSSRFTPITRPITRNKARISSNTVMTGKSFESASTILPISKKIMKPSRISTGRIVPGGKLNKPSIGGRRDGEKYPGLNNMRFLLLNYYTVILLERAKYGQIPWLDSYPSAVYTRGYDGIYQLSSELD